MNCLMIRLSSMGDIIHTFPALSDWGKHFPNSSLTWLVEPAFSFIASLHPHCKHVLDFPWRQWRKRWYAPSMWRNLASLRHTIQSQPWDLVIDAQGLIKSAWPASWANCPLAGYDVQNAREGLASMFYDRCYPIPESLDAVTRNRQLFAHVFGYELDNLPLEFGVPISSEEPLLSSPYLVFVHGSSRQEKLWPEKNWLNLLKHCTSTGYDVYLTAGNHDEHCRSLYLAQHNHKVKAWPPQSLARMYHLLSHAACVIGVDTGLLHLANALDRPCIGLYTHSDPRKTGVVEGVYAKNLGGLDLCPDVEDVLSLYQTWFG